MKIIKIVGMFLLAIIIMGISQTIALLFDIIIPFYGIGTILSSITYILLTFLVVRWIITHVFKEGLSSYRMTKPVFHPIYLILGIALPCVVYAIYFIFIPGDFKVHHFNSISKTIHDLSYIIFMQAAAGAIVEEMVCRGLLMGYIEKKTNIRIAIIVTSLFFGVIHLLNGALNVTSFFLLLVSGTLVGMMFGIATYRFNTIWASITLHFFWNVFQVVYITTKETDYNVFQYVLRFKNMVLTGGQFGFETSIVSTIGYTIVIIVLLMCRSPYKDSNL
mgnify:FL=1